MSERPPAVFEPQCLRRISTAADILKRTMNKLLGKKKAPPPEPVRTNLDAFASLANNSTVSPTSPTLRKTSSRWKRSKKQVEEKPDLTLPLSLPTQDDFRTSLLMPNLSARFSMLREQDDPRSKIGKASDDSVLQPRRRSRLMDHGFGYSHLGDIAEVQSINSSIRPPFANERQFSQYGSEDGYGSEAEPLREAGSVMSRARPGEGNIMFGGRQKIYKIAGNGGKGLGKAVYEDDINLSAFQQYRRKEREREQQEREERERGSEDSSYSYYDDPLNTPNDSAKDLSHSPAFSLEKKRSTASSTARSEARSSTAATSIHSQPHANGSSPHFAIAQPSSLPPPSLGSLKRQDTKTRRLYEPALDQHIQDQQNTAMARFNSVQRNRNLSNSGRAGPPVLHTAKSVSHLNERASQNVYAVSEEDSLPSAPFLNLGSFGKFDTASFSAPTSAINPSGLEADDTLNQALEPNDRGKATAMGAFNKPSQQFDALQYLERQQLMQRAQSRTGSHSNASHTRGRSTSASSGRRSRSPSASASATRSSNDGPKPYNLFHSAAARAGAQQSAKEALPDTHRTFFGNISASDSEDDEPVSGSHGFASNNRGWQPSTLPSVSEHPALRSQKSKPDVADAIHPSLRPAESSRSLRSASDRPVPKAVAADSPTLGPGESTSQGLNSFVHHLRQRSNQSSIYPADEPSGAIDVDAPEVPSLSGANLELVNCRVRSPVDGGSRLGSTQTYSNPWDLDEFDSSRASHASVGPEAQRGASQKTLGVSSTTQSVHEAGELSWQAELRSKTHNRDLSSSTQQERDAFANELAARRNAIQENIKSIVDRDQSSSRGASPAPGSSGGFKPFGVKSKSSRESMAARDPPSKAKQLLGMTSDVGTSKRNENRESSLPRRSDTTSRFRQESRSRYESDTKWSFDQPTRSRSNSARSRSRTGRPRDEIQKALVEGLGGPMDAPVRAPFEPTPRASPTISPDVTQSPTFEQSSRSRSGSRPTMTHYFDAKAASTSRLQNAASSSASSLASANVSRSAVTSQTMTPPVSGASTPMTGVFSPGAPGGPMTATQYRTMPRRRTVSKHDISEPMLVTSTSNIDTVELPEGASLKNGMVDAPPVPPINPKRRLKIFGRGRGDEGEDGQSTHSVRSSDYAVPRSPESIARSETRQRTLSGGNASDGHIDSPTAQQSGVGGSMSSPDRLGRSSKATTGVTRF